MTGGDVAYATIRAVARGETAATSSGGQLEVRLLGGVDIVVGEQPVAIGGAKPRAVLALLALQPDVVVSVDQMVDEIWGDVAPPTVRSSVQVHISNIRRSAASAGADAFVQTRAGGYVFTADPNVVDVHRFGCEVQAARAAFADGDMEGARMSAHTARTLWRGTPLAGISESPFVASRVVALEDEFLSVVELYADIEIALGRSAEVVGELERVVAAHPYRETAWARLSLALYRSGRQVDALDRLKTVRRILAEDLGLDPSPDLAALELAVLQQDPALRGEAFDRSADLVDPPVDSSLPPVGSLVGRDEFVHSIGDALSASRLVTIVGPGGVGKTSSALTAASRLCASGVTGARFVDFSALPPNADVVPSVMAGVGVRSGDLGLAEVVVTLNAGPETLLVFDNCEHVVDSAAQVVVELLSRCPSLRVLATTRAALSVPGEVILTCGPLERDPAIELFIERAQMSNRDYVAGDAERVAIGAMVDRLDGLPLALELFAARVRSLSAVDMLRRLSDDDVLNTSWRTAGTPRHRSLHEVISWSYNLLDEDERRCLRHLSVFGGSVGSDGVLAVCDIPHLGVLDQLVALSLVVADRTATGVRYRLLDTVRAFAGSELVESSDAVEVRNRLLDWVTAWARARAIDVVSSEPSAAIDEFEANVANVRAAHEIASADHRDAIAAARLLAAFGPWGLSLTPSLPEAVSWARIALADDRIAEADRMMLLIVVAKLTNVGTDERKSALREAIDIGERLDRTDALAAAWAVYSLVATDRAADALAISERAIELAVRARQPVTLAWALNTATTELVRLRRFEEARQLLDEHCVAGTARFGVHEGHILFQRGRLAMLLGDLETASREFSAAERASIRTKSQAGLSTSWYGQAEVARLAGKIDTAFDLYRRCLPIDLVLEPGETGLVRMMIVWTACLLGETAVAEHHVEVLALELALENTLTDATTMIEATAVSAEGLLALAKGMRTTAHAALHRSIRLWAECDCWDVVADLIDRLPELCDDPEAASRFRATAAALRDGSISLQNAVDSLELAI